MQTLVQSSIAALAARTWRRHLAQVAGLAWFGIVLLAVFVHDPAQREAAKLALFAFVALAFASKEAVDAPANWRRAGAAWRERRGALRVVLELFPPEIRGWGTTFWRQQLGFAAWLRAGRAMPAPDEGDAHGYLRRSGYLSLLPLVVSSAVVDIPVLFLMLGMVELSLAQHVAIHALSLLVHGLAITTLIGDRFLLGAGRHRLTDAALEIDLGARAAGAIPREAIVAAARCTCMPAAHLLSAADAVVVPRGRPNVALELDPAAAVRLRLLGATSARLRRVYLHVDDAERLVAALAMGKT